jgi:4-aminobutyrate aminotransferase-like enzyme
MALHLTRSASDRAAVLSLHGKAPGSRYLCGSRPTDADRHSPFWLRGAALPLCEGHDAIDYGECEEPIAAAIAAIASRPDLDDIGAVLVEPVLGSVGNFLPRRGFLAALSDLCREREWLLIFDESLTGFGRTGELFAFGTFGVEPDVVVLGRGLGGGFPFSAVCASRALWDESALGAPPAVTTRGDLPLAAAAAGAALAIIAEPGFLERIRTVGTHAAWRLRELADSSPRIARPRGIGLMLGFDLLDPGSGDLASPRECEAVFRACRDRGALIAATAPRIRLTPSLTLSLEEADRLFDVIGEVTA